jgi:hypothetical protein
MLARLLPHIRIPLVRSIPNLGLLLNKSVVAMEGLFQFQLTFIKLGRQLLDFDAQ